jgi:inner membrane protein
MKNFLNSATGKLLFIGILVLILLIPTGLIRSLVSERENRQEEAINEVSEKWSREQIVAGPILKIPYIIHWQEAIYDKDGKFLRHEDRERTKDFFALPEELKIKGNVIPEIRNRGIYEVVLYRSQLDFEGVLPEKDFLEKNVEEGGEILWEKASIAVGLSDMRGIEENPSFTWNEESIEFEPETQNEFIPVGIHAKIQDIPENGKSIFHFSLALKGSRNLSFLPLGKNTNVDVTSSWISPSFDGNFLPTSHDVSEKGFTANWNIPYLERNFPQTWSSDEKNQNVKYQLDQSAFGVKLIVPVDFYQKNERSVKYSLLFVLLTFITFFLFEILQKLQIHPFQYFLVGIAMCVFYLLLLSMSEHVSFGMAYVIASVATIGLISAYSFAILKPKKNAMVITALLIAVYIYLYILLQLQDYALLLGSIFVFLVLSTLMYLTRKIDWYALNKDGKNPQ